MILIGDFKITLIVVVVQHRSGIKPLLLPQLSYICDAIWHQLTYEVKDRAPGIKAAHGCHPGIPI